MQKNSEVDFLVVLLLFGIYFVLKYFTEMNIYDLLYGCILIYYHIKLKYFPSEDI